MRIYVNGADVTEKVIANSVTWKRYGTNRSEFSFRLEPFFADGITVSYGMSAQLIDDYGQIAWSGIVNEIKETYRNEYRGGISVRCKGLESILSRRICSEFSVPEAMTGAIVQALMLTYIASTSSTAENILYNSALVCTGAPVTDYSVQGHSLSRIFDDLAKVDGSKWWIKEDGTFYFLADVPITESAYCIDVTGAAENRLTDLISLGFERGTGEYRNVQTVIGKDGIKAESRNDLEIARMAKYGGSGRYENVMRNDMITTQGAATTAAANILRSYATDNVNVTFETNTYGFRLFDRIRINAPQFGLYGLTPFVITEITANDRPTGDRNLGFTYKITARLSSEGETTFRPTEYWTETIARISK